MSNFTPLSSKNTFYIISILLWASVWSIYVLQGCTSNDIRWSILYFRSRCFSLFKLPISLLIFSLVTLSIIKSRIWSLQLLLFKSLLLPSVSSDSLWGLWAFIVGAYVNNCYNFLIDWHFLKITCLSLSLVFFFLP